MFFGGGGGQGGRAGPGMNFGGMGGDDDFS